MPDELVPSRRIKSYKLYTRKHMEREIKDHLKTLHFEEIEINQSLHHPRRPFRRILMNDDKVLKIYEKCMNNNESDIMTHLLKYDICPPILSISHTKNYIFLMMERLHGTLDDILNEVTLQDIENILYKMKVLWSLGYKHGDFHPKNVLFKRHFQSIEWYIIDYEYSERITHDIVEEFVVDYIKDHKEILYDIYIYDQRINSHT